MSQKERQRHHLLQMVIDGKSSLKDATERMGVSYRHAKRHTCSENVLPINLKRSFQSAYYMCVLNLTQNHQFFILLATKGEAEQ